MVAVPIVADLGGLCGQLGIIAGGLYLNDAAFRDLVFRGLAFLHLLGRVEPEVGMTRALVSQLADAEHFGLEGMTNRVEQIL